MHKAEKIFLTVVIIPLSVAVIFLLFYFLVLPFYGKNKINQYYEFTVKPFWDGKETMSRISPAIDCERDCFGKENSVECIHYNDKYDICQMQCLGVLCGSCVKQGLLNELRCFQLYSR